MSNPMLGGAPRMSLAQMLQQLRSNPMHFINRAGFRAPINLSDPNYIIQYLMQTGQVSQERYNQVFQLAQQLRQ